jgi:hypothetical protein
MNSRSDQKFDETENSKVQIFKTYRINKDNVICTTATDKFDSLTIETNILLGRTFWQIFQDILPGMAFGFIMTT